MKIFTKIFMAVSLLVVYITGYGANLAYELKNDGVYLPTKTETGHVSGKTCSMAGFDFAALNQGLTKTLKMPEMHGYQFTANAAKEPMLGLRVVNVSSVDGGLTKPSLSVYPNPTRGMIEIQLDQAKNESYKITLSNTIGQVVRTIKVPEQALNPKIKLDLSTYPAGIYFYSLLVNDKMVETKRLILQQ